MTHLSARRTAGSPSRRSGCFSNAPQSFGIMRHAYTAGPGEVVRDIAPGGRNTGGVPANSAWHTVQSGYETAAARPRNASEAGVFSFSRAILVLSLQKPKPECFT